VLLTTQYLDEADQLAHQVVIVDRGCVIAHETTSELKGLAGREHGFFDRMRSLPVPRIALATGQVAGETLIVAWGVAMAAAMSFAFGFRVHGSVGEALFAYVLVSLGHTTTYRVVLTLAWSACLVVVFAPLVLIGYSKSA
jgi:hypothetical protein